ncbi:isoprenylcysteine carboxyl methyltransferase family protein [Priestia abyssalis]|uniref:isoprenylcysteine carboxyl methyltransferase family protein n=1 Tax=Priestia abyssalis TaxID=1221450 RepID=UPI000995D0E9|nr:isoprenylcysteine carboxylmethyltransferase family protein [Priestia abyssalis]
MLFYAVLTFIIIQRLLELAVAKRNEKWMREQGAVEIGQSHYKWIVLVHFLFFISLISEVVWMERKLSSFWGLLAAIFLFTQLGRLWTIASLGRFWNTKILVLPKADVVLKGPYKFLKHPNYVIVALEFLIIPLLFEAYTTMVLFSLLNILVLSIRIPAEEKALSAFTNYKEVTECHSRFLPVKNDKNSH